jgi:hypothetical protein
MQKKRLLCILLLICISSVYALEEEEYYSGTVYHQNTVTIDNQEFFFSMSGTNKVYVRLPSTASIVIKNDSCELIEYYDICVKEAGFWFHNATIDQDFYQADVEIFKTMGNRAELTLTREIADTDLLIGEYTPVNVRIKNEGKAQASGIVYSDLVPSAFTINNMYGCIVEAINSSYKAIKWKGNINPGKEVSCSYNLYAQDEIVFKSTALLQYDNGVEIQQISSNEQTISIREHQLKISYNVTPEKIGINEQFVLSINLTNINEDYEAKIISFNILIPPYLEIIDYDNRLAKTGKQLNLEYKLKPLNSIAFDIMLKAEYTQNYTIRPKAVFSTNNINDQNERVINIEVTGSILVLNTMLSSSIESGNNSNIKIELLNPSTTESLNSIWVNIWSNIPNFQEITREFEVLPPSRSLWIDDVLFTAPSLEDNTTYSLNITVLYTSDYGQKFHIEENKNVTIVGKVSNAKETAVTEMEDSDKQDAVNVIVNKTSSLVTKTIQAVKSIELKNHLKKEELYILIGVGIVGLTMLILFIMHKIKYG